MIKVIKKDGTVVDFNDDKIKKAIGKSADRVCIKLTDKQKQKVCDYVRGCITLDEVPVKVIHNLVETALDKVNPAVAKSYREYRDNKSAFADMLDKVYNKKLGLNFIGDRSNANADSAIITTQRSIVYNELNSELYKKFFLTEEEKSAMNDGYIYIHDRGSRLDSFNCFRRDTSFITDKGIKSFYDFNDGDQCYVITHKGRWKKAVVHCYGYQPIQEVVLQRNHGKPHSVFVTKNHRWILKDGTETTCIKVGDKLVRTPDISTIEWEKASQEDKKMWCYGFGVGDGSASSHSFSPLFRSTLDNSVKIRLCGDKVKYASRFTECGYSVTYPKCYKGDARVVLNDMHRKILPLNTLNRTTIKYFVDGLISADGCKNHNGGSPYCRIAATGIINYWLNDLLNVAGYYTTNIVDRSGQKTNYGTVADNSFDYSFYTDCGDKTWKVVDIKPAKLNPRSQVWCLEVEEDHSFLLEGGIPTGNCCLADMKNILTGGFEMGNLHYNEPKTLDCVMDLVGDVIMNMASCQYGGYTVSEIDKLLSPYAEKSYNKYYSEYLESEIQTAEDLKEWPLMDFQERLFEKKADEYSMKKVKRDFEQGWQGLEMKLNSVGSSRGDYPFTAITFGLGKNKFETLASSTCLSVRKKGQGKEGFEHPVLFPKLSFLYDENLHGEGKELEWLFLEAIDCSSKAMYPDFISCTGDGYCGDVYRKYGKTISRMGALAGHEHLYVKIDDGDPVDISIKDLFDYCDKDTQLNARRCQLYFNKITKSTGNSALFRDKILKYKIEDKSGVYSIRYIPEDVTYIGSSSNINRRLREHRAYIRKYGKPDCGINFNDYNLKNYEFKVIEYCNNYIEKEKEYILNTPNVNFKGTSQRYYKCINKYKNLKERPDFKQDTSIDQLIIDLSNLNIKVLDRDNKWVKVNTIFKNDKSNSPYMMHIYYKEGDKTFCLSCTEDHPLWTGNKFTRADQLKIGDILYRADGLELPIVEVAWHWYKCDSYDISTATGSFIGSDVIMHNCRATLPLWFERGGFEPADENDSPIFEGRFNMGAISLHFPMILKKSQIEAEKSNQKVDRLFFKNLKYYCKMIRDIHKRTFNYFAKKKAGTNPLAFCQGGTYKGNFKPDDIIGREFLRPMSASFGITALNETQYLYNGKSLVEDSSFALKILQWMDKYKKQATKEDKILYALYGTPAESLCGLQVEQFRNKFGDQKGITDKPYTSNSFHCAVYEDITPIEKQDIEYPLYHYCTGGAIQYCRYPINYNTEAVVTLVRRAMKMGFYEGINLQLDYCEDCGTQFIDSDKCPKCGSENITRIERMNGYLGYSKVNGRTMYADHKLAEFKDRKSM